MDYLDVGGYFNDLYEETFLNRCGNNGEIFAEMMEVNLYEIEIYEKAVCTFIEFLEEKQDDSNWLLKNQDLVIKMFTELIRSVEAGDLLPALRVLEKDPEFSSMLDENIRALLMQHNMVA